MKTVTNRCKTINGRGAARNARTAGQTIFAYSRRKTVNGPDALRRVSARIIVGAPSARRPALRIPPPPVSLPADAVQSRGLFKTDSGLDTTSKVIELLWLASEQNYLSFEQVQEILAGDKLTPDDMTGICRILEQAGVSLVAASAGRSVQLKPRSTSTQNCLQQIAREAFLEKDVDATPSRRMEAADHEMRQVIYSFGFAVHEHIVRAEKLLACPSEERLDNLIANSKIRSRRQYLNRLPALVKQVRKLDQKAATAYREWRQRANQTNGEQHLIEFRKLSHNLQQILPKFSYQAKTLQEIIAIEQSIAVQFRTSQRVLQQIQQSRGSVCQLPLADVERQAIETMEEFVRMPCEEFLRNCSQLKLAAAKFQQARCQLIHDHLHLVPSIAGAYCNESLTLPQVLREGIFGLVRAVEKYDHRHASNFSTYASCSIRQRIRESLTAQPCKKADFASVR